MDKKIDELESKISFYLPIAWGFVAGAIVPLFYAGFVVFAQNKYWQEADLGSFIGGVSGTLAALSGVFFVYVAFLGQRISIIQQQIELQDNRKELRETRIEIQGQKEQLERQNKQFQIQSFERVFFDLISFFKNQSESNFALDYGDIPLKESLSSFVNYYRNSLTYDKWNSMPDIEKVSFLAKTFDSKFGQGFVRVRSMVEISLNILIHINEYRELINPIFFINIFKSSLNVNEQRIIFYAFFSSKNYLEEEHRILLKWFLQEFTLQNLLDARHKELLDAFD